MNVAVLPAVKAKLLEGKKGLIVGIANENSIAWGCAKAFRALGAEVAVTYVNDKAKKYVEPLARALDAPIVMPLDVNTPGQMEAVFERISKEWNNLDFLVHSIAFSPKEALQGRVVDVSREGFATTMDVSCWTFIRMAHLAEPLMRKGGTLFTMSYYGSQMVVKNYNIMGVAKAALESAVRYLAAELGPKGIRVHAISPGPLATRAASGIPEFDALLDKAKEKAPARSLVSIDDVGVATAFLAHDAARLITGETLIRRRRLSHHRLEQRNVFAGVVQEHGVPFQQFLDRNGPLQVVPPPPNVMAPKVAGWSSLLDRLLPRPPVAEPLPRRQSVFPRETRLDCDILTGLRFGTAIGATQQAVARL